MSHQIHTNDSHPSRQLERQSDGAEQEVQPEVRYTLSVFNDVNAVATKVRLHLNELEMYTTDFATGGLELIARTLEIRSNFEFT